MKIELNQDDIMRGLAKHYAPHAGKVQVQLFFDYESKIYSAEIEETQPAFPIAKETKTDASLS